MTMHTMLANLAGDLAVAGHILAVTAEVVAIVTANIIRSLITGSINHPRIASVLGFAFVVHHLASRLVDARPRGMSQSAVQRSRPAWDVNRPVEQEQRQQATKTREERFDLDFDDYKLVDPDYAIHGYRSGDKIDDQRSHDRWEHCNDGSRPYEDAC